MIRKIISEHGGAVGIFAVIVAIVGLSIVIVGKDDTSVLGHAVATLINSMQTTLIN